jgi:hypothetical protein
MSEENPVASLDRLLRWLLSLWRGLSVAEFRPRQSFSSKSLYSFKEFVIKIINYNYRLY